LFVPVIPEFGRLRQEGQEFQGYTAGDPVSTKTVRAGVVRHPLSGRAPA
jgi:hypothetical protein